VDFLVIRLSNNCRIKRQINDCNLNANHRGEGVIDDCRKEGAVLWRCP